MDDYGRPLDPLPSDNAAGDDDCVRHNVGLISEWHSLRSDCNVLLSIAKPGDLLEFKREGYCHWAVYIGDHVIRDPQGDSGDAEDFLVCPCIVHRANPTDSENIQNMFSTSRSLSKGVHGIGAVVVEPLRDVWSRSECRINNGLDNTLQPYSSQKVAQRALSVANGENSLSLTAYNVVSNNCEHFASWCRCGWNISCQVARRGEQVLKLAMMAGAAILPRPLAAIGGLCVAGLHMVGDMRRTTREAANNVYYQFTDSAVDTFDDITDNNRRTSHRNAIKLD